MADKDPYGLVASGLPEGMAAEARRISRQQAIAEALMGQSMQPIAMRDTGRLKVAPHWLEGAAKLAQAYAARSGFDRSNADATALGQRYQTGLADEVRRVAAIRSGQAVTPDPQEIEQSADQGTPMPRTSTADPRAAVEAAMLSQYAPVRQMGTLEYSHMKKADEPYTLKPGDTRVTPGQPNVVAPPDDKHAIPANWQTALPPGAKREPNDPAGVFRMPGPDKQDDVYAVKYENGRAVGYQKLDNAPRDPNAAASKNPYFTPVSTAKGVYAFDARTGTMKLIQADGGPVVRETADPALRRDLSAANAGGKIEGETQATAAVNLPQTITTAERNLNLVDQLVGSKDGKVKRHPGFTSSVGWTWTPGMRFVEGSKEAGFMALLGQVQGASFLDAFEKLKGGGAISETEGTKATQAISRLSKAQSEVEFTQAARELQDILRQGVANARTKASGTRGAARPTTSPAPAAPASPAPQAPVRVVDW